MTRQTSRGRWIASRAVREALGQADLLTYRVRARSSTSLRLPDFLGIGAQKAGTTWLHANLACHPQLFLPVEKEVHYFDWFEKTSLRRYAAVFEPAGDRRAGDISPGYSALSRRRIATVRRLVPEAKVLLLLRDPVERAWSQLLMTLRRNGRDPSSMTDAELLAAMGSRGARRRGQYVRMITDWSERFGEDRLWIGFYEDIATRPVELLSEVFVHLGVAPPQDWSALPLEERFNPGSGVRPPPGVRRALDRRYQDDLDRLEERFPVQVGRWRRDEERSPAS